MVDVMLVLLIIFMVTSASMISEFNIKLPNVKSPASQDLGSRNNIEITITKDKKIYISDNLVNRQQLKNKLLASFKSSSHKKILLAAEDKVLYSDLMSIVDMIKMCGFKKISLVGKLSTDG